MKKIRTILLIATTVILLPGMASAGPCDATFNFDGNLSDSSGNGNDGMMIGKGGVPAKPVYVEGRSGQALRFDGTSAMRAPLDLYIGSCPQITISAWVKIDADSPKTTQYLVSTGSGSGPGLRVSGSGLSLNGPANGLFQANAIRANSGWRFVAGVYDYEAGTFALHWRDRPIKVVPMSPNIREWEDMLWVGAMNDQLSPAATGIVIDDVRIEGRASTFEQLHSLKVAIPTGAPGTEGAFEGNTPRIGDADPSQLPGDHFEPTQLPGDHFEPTQLPGDHFEPGIGDGAQQQTEPQVVRNLQVPMTDSDSGIPQVATGAITSAGGEVGLSDSDSERLQAAAAENAPLELGYDSEEEGIAAAEAAAEARADAAAAESEEPSQASGVPRASGEPVFSAVSGHSGSIVRTVDLRFQFLDSIHWRENSDRPCRMQVSGWVLDDLGKPYDGDTAVFVGRCGTGSWDHRVSTGLDSTKAITRLQVCNNNRNNQRLKGLRVWGSQINSDGTTTYIPNSDSDEAPNCASWGTSVLCPNNTVGTGLVVHAAQASGSREQIVGLQLVCRGITLQ